MESGESSAFSFFYFWDSLISDVGNRVDGVSD